MTSLSEVAPVVADGPFANELMLYGRFVGAWDVGAACYDGEVVRPVTGERRFAWGLGGRGAQDVLYGAGAIAGQIRRCAATIISGTLPGYKLASGEFVYLQGRQLTMTSHEKSAVLPRFGQRERWRFT